MRRWTLCLAMLTLAACGVEGPASGLDTNASSLASADAAGFTNSDGGCPATWADARSRCAATGSSCTGFGAHCSYPGAGDALPDGTWATAVLFCFDTSGTGAGPGEWRCAQ